MFDHKHYVPILRWKAAERDALLKLKPSEKEMITPVFEFIMPQPKAPKQDEKAKTPEEQREESINKFQLSILEMPEQISKYWGRTPVFIDMRLIDGSIRAEALERLLALGTNLDLFMIPVVNIIPVIDFESDIKTRAVAIKFAKQGKHGLCLRLSPLELNSPSFADDIDKFVAKSGLLKKDIDLLVDQGLIGEGDSTEIGLANIPDLKEWRTLTLIGGSFPPDLSKFLIGADTIERYEWSGWLKEINKNLKRKPSFGDYTILHPIYREPVRGAIPSASIRYTLKDRWLIMRGQGGAKKNHSQYLANARLLKEHADFFGENFSYGDGYIAEKSKDLNSKETGSARTWLTAGINHHLVCAISQLSSVS
ncbi:MAG: beta family protein [Patescibacteria group bacterium]